jgi:hypothetical protein
MYSWGLATGERVKKCASCSKDLPEAALHCVFCGAKQAPAPAVPASAVAKTAFGYSANELIQQIGNQPRPPAQPQPPQPAYQPPQPAYQPPQQPAYQPAPSAANAKTMMAPGGPPQMAAPQPYSAPSPGFGGQAPQPYTPPSAGGGMGIHSQQQQATPAPLPAVQPYLAAQTGAARMVGRPIEPWKDSLKLMMFVWGAVALAAFATPVMTEPMAFNWDTILDGEGSAKIPALVWAGVGLLSIVFAAIPMASAPRGALAAVLGLSGIFVPMAVSGHFGEWQELIQLVGALVLVAGLLVRHEYVESTLARVLVTVGVVCTLLPYLVPIGGQIPLVMLIKALLNAGSGMEIVIIGLAHFVLAVLCLLVWMPGPATAGAKVFAWAVILFPVVAFTLKVLGKGDIGDLITTSPGALLAWAPGVAYSVLAGYGAATVIGKQLE